MLTSILLLWNSLFLPATFADTTDTSEWKIYDHKDYSIRYPANWTLDTSGDSGMSFIISSPFTDEEDMYYDFVNLSILPMQGLNKTLDTYAEDVIKDIPFFYQKAIITEKKKDKKSNLDCYTLTYAGLMSGFPLALHQYIWFENDTSYQLQFISEQKSFQHWDKIARQMMDSFSFKK
jgi:hypothetical protein